MSQLPLITTYSYDKNGNTQKFVTATPTEHTFSYNGVDLKTSYTSSLPNCVWECIYKP